MIRIIRSQLGVAAVGALVWGGATAAQDWPVYQQNNQRNARTTCQLDVSRLGVQWIWASDLPPRPAWYGPAKWDAYSELRGLKSMRNYDVVFHPVADGQHVWFGTSVDDAVYCLDAETGQLLWRFVCEAPVRAPPTLYQGRLYFGSDDGYVYCLRAADGELVWKYTPRPEDRRILHDGRFISQWPVRTGVLIEGGRAYFGASLLPWQPTYLCAIDAETGAADRSGCFVHTLDATTLEGPMACVPGKSLVSPRGRVPPQLFDLASPGAPRPLGTLQGGGGSFVVVNRDTVFHGPGNKAGWITASRLATGESVATFRAANALVATDDTFHILTDNELMAMDATSHNVRWSVPSDCTLSLILAGKTLFAGGTDKVCGFLAADGKLVWTHPVDGRVFGMAVAQGRLLVSTDAGSITAFAENRATPAALPAASEHADEVRENGQELAPIRPVHDDSLVGRWVFQKPLVQQKMVRDLTGRHHASISGTVNLETIGAYQALQFDGQSPTVTLSHQADQPSFPDTQLTAEAWVRIDQPSRWGGLIGCIQDNGDDEHGWLLGYESDHFSFALAAENPARRLTYLPADQPFTPRAWHHVAATYDGRTMRLFVNGRLSAVSETQTGPVRYPQRRHEVIGAYRDDNEEYLLKGMLHEVRVYNRALNAQEIADHYEARKRDFPAALEPPAASPRRDPAVGPWLRFTSANTADVHWHTRQPCPTVIEYSLDGQRQRVVDPALKEHHVAHLKGLRHRRVYTYQIEYLDGEQVVKSRPYECDTFFNFDPMREAPLAGEGNEQASADWEEVVRANLTRLPGDRGLCLVLGLDDGQLLRAIARSSRLRIAAWDTDRERIARLRTMLAGEGPALCAGLPTPHRREGLYGTRVTIHYARNLSRLPITGRCANLILSESLLAGRPTSLDLNELDRLLEPGGTACLIWPTDMADTPAISSIATSHEAGHYRFATWSGRAIEGAGTWTHVYGSPGNTHYQGETLAGATSTDDLVVQWIGRPGPRYQADRNGRKPPPLAAGGRLFLQGLERIVALDQYNGTILWSLEIPGLGRFNMPRDCGNWCVNEDVLFVAVRDQCWQIDAARGQVTRMHHVVVPQGREPSEYDWGYLAFEGGRLLGSAVRRDALWTSFWGKSGWYDAPSGPEAAKVTGDNLFAIDPNTGDVIWQYEGGLIVHSTVAAGDGQTFFVEARGENLAAQNQRRRNDKDFWADQHLVALDAQRGRVVWQRPVDTADGEAAFYMSYGSDRLAVVASQERYYYIYTIDARTGSPLWSTSILWGKGRADHGTHLSRPAIVGDRLFVRPAVFELSTGKQLEQAIPIGGCGTYAATARALFFRAGSGQNTSVWDIETGRYTSWPRLRPDCWLSTVPAGGMLLAPEGGGGCSCGSWIETSLGFIPRKNLD